MKKGVLLIFLLCFILISVTSPVYALSYSNSGSPVPKIVVNGERLNLSKAPFAANNRTMVPAREVLSKLGITVDWYPNDNLIQISKEQSVIYMKIEEASYSINDDSVYMDAAPVLVDGVVMVPVSYVVKAFGIKLKWDEGSSTVYLGDIDKVPVTSTNTSTNTSTSASSGNVNSKFIVVIDAGHGGYETGAISQGIKEKDLNLDIAKRLNTLLMNSGVKTYMTRVDDRYVDLYARSGLANRVKADLLISIHNNAEDSSSTTGSMSLYYPSNSKSKGKLAPSEFAGIVQKELVGQLGVRNLGIIQRPHLAVLRTANMPAVIAEVGYMTNRKELSKLLTTSYKQKSAEALKKAVLASLKQI